jgi:hypothetical protein
VIVGTFFCTFSKFHIIFKGHPILETKNNAQSMLYSSEQSRGKLAQQNYSARHKEALLTWNPEREKISIALRRSDAQN